MRGVFVDTVGLLALWDEDDQWHSSAEAAWTLILSTSRILYTTPFILAECANAASREMYRSEVEPARRQFESAHTLIWPTAPEWDRAWRAFSSQRPGAPGLVDQLSFVVMRRLGITDAFTNDRHFKAAGFNTLF